jgi:hypothetical protein
MFSIDLVEAMIGVRMNLPVLEHNPVSTVAALLSPRAAVVFMLCQVTGWLVNLTELAVQFSFGTKLVRMGSKLA